MKAVIPAGGMGTRMFPRTNNGEVSKEMLPINDAGLTAIEYAIMRLVASGVTDIAVVSGERKTDLNDYVRGLMQDAVIAEMLNIEVVMQIDPHGLGDAFAYGAVKRGAGQARNEVVAKRTPFLGVLPDDLFVTNNFEDLSCPVVKELIAIVERGGNGVATMVVPDEKVESYGIVAFGKAGNGGSAPITGFVEKPPLSQAPSRSAIVGMYGFQATIISALDATEPDHKGEVQVTDAMRKSVQDGNPFEGVELDARVARHDIGTPEGYDAFRDYVRICEESGAILGTLGDMCRDLQSVRSAEPEFLAPQRT